MSARRLLAEQGQRKNVLVATGNNKIRLLFPNQLGDAFDICRAGCGGRNEVYGVAAEVAGRLGNTVRADQDAALTAGTERVGDTLRREAPDTQKQQAELRLHHSGASDLTEGVASTLDHLPDA